MLPRDLVRFVARDFIDFVVHQKKWWLTGLLLVIAAFVALAFFNEPRPVRPIIYTDY